MTAEAPDTSAVVARMHRSGSPPSAILRAVATQHPEYSAVDLMDVLREAFGLSFGQVQCVGGWWHDGTGELNDLQLDAFLAPASRQASH